jgi:fructose-1,6-bisphosphatase/inositol monophosphatase family enzyme
MVTIICAEDESESLVVDLAGGLLSCQNAGCWMVQTAGNRWRSHFRGSLLEAPS